MPVSFKLNLQSSPGLNAEYPRGTTGLWSDHAPFAANGIPYAYFESTNWTLWALKGYNQTVKDGEIWHTYKDTMSYIERIYPLQITAAFKYLYQGTDQSAQACK